jgi:hypothetical protein
VVRHSEVSIDLLAVWKQLRLNHSLIKSARRKGPLLLRKSSDELRLSGRVSFQTSERFILKYKGPVRVKLCSSTTVEP